MSNNDPHNLAITQVKMINDALMGNGAVDRQRASETLLAQETRNILLGYGYTEFTAPTAPRDVWWAAEAVALADRKIAEIQRTIDSLTLQINLLNEVGE